MVPTLHFASQFNRLRARHELWKKEYPDTEHRHGVPFTGVANARPETKALAKPKVDRTKLPFDPLECLKHKLPFDPNADPSLGR